MFTLTVLSTASDDSGSQYPIEAISPTESTIPSVNRNPRTRSKSSPGVRIVTAMLIPARRISSGSSAAMESSLTVHRFPIHRWTPARLSSPRREDTLISFYVPERRSQLYRPIVLTKPPPAVECYVYLMVS